MSRSIAELREHLFATLEGLRDKDAPLDLDRAKAIADVAQTIINSAKAEVDYLRAAGGVGMSQFMQPTPTEQVGTNVRVHRLKG